MSLSTANLPVLMVDGGLYSDGAATSGSTAANSRNIYRYSSTDNSTQINQTGYFTSCGAGGRANTGVGMKIGDLLCNIESDNGRVTWHSVINSTFNQASTKASTAYNGGFDVTVSST